VKLKPAWHFVHNALPSKRPIPRCAASHIAFRSPAFEAIVGGGSRKDHAHVAGDGLGHAVGIEVATEDRAELGLIGRDLAEMRDDLLGGRIHVLSGLLLRRWPEP
jgi:hypothetical protein